jgi:hypothetical protein
MMDAKREEDEDLMDGKVRDRERCKRRFDRGGI